MKVIEIETHKKNDRLFLASLKEACEEKLNRKLLFYDYDKEGLGDIINLLKEQGVIEVISNGQIKIAKEVIFFTLDNVFITYFTIEDYNKLELELEL